jgi:hypothetical protein
MVPIYYIYKIFANTLSLRLFNRSHTRTTLGFSKTLRNHKLAVALQVAHFNFCRPHSALKIAATDTTPAQEQTPAMAQGIANRVWRVGELLGGGNRNCPIIGQTKLSDKSLDSRRK